MLQVRMLTTVWVIAGAVAVVLALGWLLQRRLISFPLLQDVPPAATTLPGAEDVAFATADGLRLRGWFAPPATSSGATVLVFNGNAGDRSSRAPLAAALRRAGLAVLLFDYRGYGRHPGTPSEKGLLADARAARRYVGSRDDGDPSRVVYVGESLGAAVAVALAVEQPPAALVLRSPFTSLADMGRRHYPLLPAGLLLRDRFDALEQIRRVRCPVLVVAGERDRIVPPAQSRRLYDAAQGAKRLVLIPGADHNDFELLAGQQLIEEVRRFLRESLPRSRPGADGN
jgi:fermentation-respiration switch protein FrsA (DUF1100 family)